jgi:nicotinamidase-related amidase
MDVKAKNAALIIVDVQEASVIPAEGQLSNPAAERNIAALICRWRRDGLPLFFVKYLSPRKASPFHEDSPGSRLRESCAPLPGETVIVKHFESAFMKTDLEARLNEAKLHTLIFTGFYTDQCIAVTSKVANNLGFEVIVVSDGTATTGCPGYINDKYYEGVDIHQQTLGSLKRDGISIIETSDLL